MEKIPSQPNPTTAEQPFGTKEKHNPNITKAETATARRTPNGKLQNKQFQSTQRSILSRSAEAIKPPPSQS